MSLKFGWCLPGIEQHDACIGSFQWTGELVCPCECHGIVVESSETVTVEEESADGQV